MSLQNPGALLWLLPLGGVVVLLYLLKMRRRELRVPATFLWPARTEEIRANSLFQRLRFSWLLVLQLLALALLVFGLARPQTRQSGLTGQTTVLVLDSSASMGATDVRPSRFEEAKRLAREAIAQARPGDRIAILEAGPVPRVVSPLSNDPAKARFALDGLTGTDAEVDVGEALRLAASLVGTVDGARIVLLSDGAFEPIRNFSRGKAALVYRNIGVLDDNLAISALGTAETPRGRQLFVGVRNASAKTFPGTITLLADGKAVDSIRFQISGKGQYGRTIAAPAGAKVFEARLEAPDVLKSDNYAVDLADPNAALRVLLVGAGDPFAERALALDPRVTLDRSATLPTDAGAKYDVVVFDGVPEQAVASRGVIALGAAGPSSPVVVQGEAKPATFESAEPHALLAGVDLRHVFIDRAEPVRAKPEGQVLAEASTGPLVVVSDRPSQRKVYLAFSPLQSDFPLQVGFPIFMANALDFVAGAASGDQIAVKPGVPFSVSAKGPVRLDGEITIPTTAGNVVVREVRTVGKHALLVDGKSREVFASLRSERESDIAPVQNLALGGGEVKATQAPARFADFWRPLLILCLLVLAGEWWLFARRS